MTAAQRKQLIGLIAHYVDNMDDGHAGSRWTRSRAASRPYLVRVDWRH